MDHDSRLSGLVIDLDGTLALESPTGDYEDCTLNEGVADRVRAHHRNGTRIIIATARNMNTFQNNLGLINSHTLPAILRWLKNHEVPFDEVYVGKPWPGPNGVYVDDRAVRPDEFVALGAHDLQKLLRSR